MALVLETGNAAGGGQRGTDWVTINESFTHALQNASGTNRVIELYVSAVSGQAGDLGISNVAYNSVAPTKIIALLHDASNRDIMYKCYWKDSDLPAAAGDYTVTFDITNGGVKPTEKYYCLEITGINQTTLDAENITNTGYGTTPQTFTPSLGDEVIAGLLGGTAVLMADPTGSWSDTLLYNGPDTSGYGVLLSVGHATDGSITGTSSYDMTGDGFIATSWAIAASAPAEVEITSVNGGNPITNGQQNVVTTGSNFEASQAGGSMSLVSGAISSDFTIDSWADGSIQGDTVQGNIPFTSASWAVSLEVTNDAASSDSLVVQFNPENDTSVIELLNPVEGDGHVNITGTPASADQYHYTSILYESDGVTPTAYTVSIDATGAITIGNDPADGTYKIWVRHWDQTNWDQGTPGTEQIVIISTPVISDNDGSWSMPLNLRHRLKLR